MDRAALRNIKPSSPHPEEGLEIDGEGSKLFPSKVNQMKRLKDRQQKEEKKYTEGFFSEEILSSTSNWIRAKAGELKSVLNMCFI